MRNAISVRRETTALQRKLEAMAQQIGNFGLAAAVFSLAAMASQFTWHTFYVEGQPWDYKYLSEYLSYVITAITIVVSVLTHMVVYSAMRAKTVLQALQACIAFRGMTSQAPPLNNAIQTRSMTNPRPQD